MLSSVPAGKQQTKTKRLILMSIFTALIAIGAFIKVPVPVVPFTLQFLFTTLAGLLLGSSLGSACVLAYILLGLLGLPIFAAGGGPGYIFNPSFGYLIGFWLGAKTFTGQFQRSGHSVSLRYALLLFGWQLCHQPAYCPMAVVFILLSAGSPR